MTRVLHVGSTAGVGAILSYANNHKCVMRALHDPYLQSATYGATMTNFPIRRGGATWFYVQAIRIARHADLLHIHGGHTMAERMHRATHKPYILHYHGTDARGVPPVKRARAERLAARLLVSTEDLLYEKYEHAPVWLPNPIDTALFRPRSRPCDNKGLAILLNGQTEHDTMERLKRYGYDSIDWTFRYRWHDARRLNPDKMLYPEMPGLLASYQYYCDMKQDHTTKSWYTGVSKTALEALAVGCQVITHDGRMLDGLPDEHRLENVAQRIQGIYNEVIEGS